MKKELYTGAYLLNDDAIGKAFGMVGGFGPSDEQGTVRVTLDIRCIPYDSDGESLTINLPEGRARQLASEVQKAAIQLEHLRALLRLGRLTPEALFDPSDEEGLDLSEEEGELKP